jgi:membrane protease YdiL (CAAX protease family)
MITIISSFKYCVFKKNSKPRTTIKTIRFFEEIIFRGFLINSISSLIPQKKGLLIAIIISSIIFGYLHSYQGVSGQILTGITGLFLCILYVKTNKNLWLCILTHGCINTISLTVLYYNLL